MKEMMLVHTNLHLNDYIATLNKYLMKLKISNLL